MLQPRMRRSRKPADSKLAPALLRWWRAHGRHDLPWQRRRTPYRVWVSEIMLQQTQVTTVIRYYRRFLGRFPGARALAAAPLDDVLHLWSGLGYYARARNLHKAAQLIRDEYNGRFPNRFEQVGALPGIGRSTAGAILALSRGERHAILDGNVKRVLTRYHAIKGWPGEKRIENRMWSLAEQHTPHKNIAAYTQAIMDLGATLCTRTRPRCDECPLASGCRAHALGRESAFPSPRPSKAIPLRRTRMLLITHADKILLEKRPPAGIWGGLWGFPEMPPAEDVASWCRRRLHFSVHTPRTWPLLRHDFSHFRLDIEPVQVEVSAASAVGDNAGQTWCDLRAPLRFGLAAPVQKLLKQLQALHEESRNDAHGQMRLAG